MCFSIPNSFLNAARSSPTCELPHLIRLFNRRSVDLSILMTSEVMPSSCDSTSETAASDSEEQNNEETSEELSLLTDQLQCHEKMDVLVGSEFHEVMTYIMESMDQETEMKECGCESPGEGISDLVLVIVSQKYGQGICPFCRDPLLPEEEGVDDIRYTWMPIHRICFDLWNLTRRRSCEACKALEKKPLKD